MITDRERAEILKRAYLPEHLPHYVTAISGTEPFLFDDFVLHRSGSQLVFVGYPLNGDFNEAEMIHALEKAKARFEPGSVSIIAPTIPAAITAPSPSQTDAYFRLDLSQLRIPKKTRNMLARARREVSVSMGEFGREHRKLVKAFIRSQQLDEGTLYIFKRLGEYAKCESAQIFEARTPRGDLAAYDIAEFGAGDYGFYMFNFRSKKHSIPGLSDLLLFKIIERAQAEGKRYLNLGLGINEGIAFFKKKWGGRPFLDHFACRQEIRTGESWGDMLDQISGL